MFAYLLILGAQSLPLPANEPRGNAHLDPLEIMAAIAIPAKRVIDVHRPLDQALVPDLLEPRVVEGLVATLLEQPLQQQAGLVGLGDLERGVGFDEDAVGLVVGFSVLIGEVVVVL